MAIFNSYVSLPEGKSIFLLPTPTVLALSENSASLIPLDYCHQLSPSKLSFRLYSIFSNKPKSYIVDHISNISQFFPSEISLFDG